MLIYLGLSRVYMILTQQQKAQRVRKFKRYRSTAQTREVEIAIKGLETENTDWEKWARRVGWLLRAKAPQVRTA